jgi:hypothetical protein
MTTAAARRWGAGARPVIREGTHLARDTAMSPHAYCVSVAEW